MADIRLLLSAGGSYTLFIVFHCVTVCSLCCTQVFWRPDGWAAGSLFHVEKEATRRILPHWDVTTNWLVCVSTHKQSSSVFVCSCSVEPAEGAVCSHTGQRDSHCGSWATFVHSSVFRCNTMLSLLCFYLHILSLCITLCWSCITICKRGIDLQKTL